MKKMVPYVLFLVLVIVAYHGQAYLTADADSCPTLHRRYHEAWVIDEAGVLHLPDYDCEINRFEFWYHGYV